MSDKLYVEIMVEPRVGIQTWHRIDVPGNGIYDNDMLIARQMENFFHNRNIVARILRVVEDIIYISPPNITEENFNHMARESEKEGDVLFIKRVNELLEKK